MSVAGALRIGRAEPGPNRLTRRLFMVGSFLFGIASVPGASEVNETVIATTYFLGSIFFTAAGAETLRTTEASDRLDLVASAVQLAGTVMFNVSTYAAIDTHLKVRSSNFLVWLPDALGSICFLIASAIAVAALRRAINSGVEVGRTRAIALTNLAGSVAFGVSAVGAILVPGTGGVLNADMAATFTLIGAVCFFVAAYLLVPRRGAG